MKAAQHVHCDSDPIECRVEVLEEEYRRVVEQSERYMDALGWVLINDYGDSIVPPDQLCGPMRHAARMWKLRMALEGARLDGLASGEKMEP